MSGAPGMNLDVNRQQSVFLVTGASGFIGRHLCQYLVDRGHKVRAVSRRDDSYLRRLNVEVRRGDLLEPGEWCDLVDGVTHVIHCAGDPTFGDGPHYQKSNVEVTSRLIEVVRRRATGIRRFVFVSTIGAVDRLPSDRCADPLTEESPLAPVSDYGRSKKEAEDIVQRSELPFCIVRPTMVLGSDMRINSHFSVFARHALRGSLLSRVAWSGRFSVVHVDDLAAALCLCATDANAQKQTYFCSSGTVSVKECFDLARPEVWRVPVGWTAPLLRPFIRWLPFSIKAMLLPALTASDKRLRELGWTPRYSSQQAMVEVVNRERLRFDSLVDPGGQTVITGAASGLGRALTVLLAPRRRNLLLIDKDRLGLETLSRNYPNCRFLVADLSKEEDIHRLQLEKYWQELSIIEMYACAGMGTRGQVLEASVDKQADVFKVNVLGRFYLARVAIEAMVRAQFGRVVFISSSAAFQPLPYMAAYAASNAAVLLLGEAWSAELASSGVQLMTVCPGGMKTNFQRAAGVKEIDGEILMAPEAVANAILRGLSAGRMTLIVSPRALAMSVLARLLPRRVSVWLWKGLMEKMR